MSINVDLNVILASGASSAYTCAMKYTATATTAPFSNPCNRLKSIAFLVAAAIAAAPACGDPDPANPASDTTGGARSFLLGTHAEAYDRLAAPPFVPAFIDPPGVSDDLAEAFVVSFEHLGLPWDAFNGPSDTPDTPPAPWVSAIDAVIASARASGKTFVLAISPLSTELDTIAANAREDRGILIVDPSFRPTCFDPARENDPTRLRDRFARYAAWLVNRARPAMVIVGRRLNMYEARCGNAAWNGMLGFVAAATTRIRAIADLPSVPGQPVFIVPPIIAGLDVDDLYGLPTKPGRCAAITIDACLEQRAALIADVDAALTGTASPDIIGLDVHPAAFVIANAGAEIPARYLSSVLQRFPDRRTAVIGTSLPATSMQSRQGPCVPHYTADADAQRRWLDLVLASARTRAMELVIWRDLADLAPSVVVASCPCAGDAALCDHLASLGSRVDDRRLRLVGGLVDFDGQPRPALDTWRAAFD